MRSLPYVVPFGAVIALLAVRPYLALPPLVEQTVWILVMTAILVLVGVAVFIVWIAPDRIFPGYHSHWLFTNSVTGAVVSSLPESSRGDWAVLTLRTLRAAVFVPIAEELFWRAWLMRWVIAPDFEKVPLGAYTPFAFCVVALLFASEHGSYWDVGLMTGVIYNAWMVRSRSLGDLILTHAVTNACLSVYVVAAGKWEYWL